jgi:hypothetical protein
MYIHMHLLAGIGDTLSTQAELDYNFAERSRESWEMEVNPDGEIQEMIDLYVSRGISRVGPLVVQVLLHTGT